MVATVRGKEIASQAGREWTPFSIQLAFDMTETSNSPGNQLADRFELGRSSGFTPLEENRLGSGEDSTAQLHAAEGDLHVEFDSIGDGINRDVDLIPESEQIEDGLQDADVSLDPGHHDLERLFRPGRQPAQALRTAEASLGGSVSGELDEFGDRRAETLGVLLRDMNRDGEDLRPLSQQSTAGDQGLAIRNHWDEPLLQIDQ